MSADFKIDKNMQEMRDLLKALETENRSPLDLAILVSLLCVDLLVSRDTISLKMVPGETRSNENVFIIIKSLVNHLYARMVFVFLNSFFFNFYGKLFDYITKKVFSFSAISVSEEIMLLLSISVIFSFAVTFSEKSGLTIFQNFLLSLTSLMSRLL